MIPKIIHYCWFGGAPKPDLVKDCISSWKKYLPDYQFMEWNEKNTKFEHRFVKNAYKLKKWAFVSDYVRLQKTYEYGGIYLDTDVLVVKNFDELLKNKMFVGIEDKLTINAAIFGATKNHLFISKILEKYSNLKIGGFVNLFSIAIPKIITETFKKTYNYNDLFLSKIEKEDIIVYPTDYFYPLPSNKSSEKNNYKNYLTVNSYAVHLWDASWVDFNEFQYIRARKYNKGFVELVKNVNHEQKINYKYLRKILSAIKESILKPKSLNC